MTTESPFVVLGIAPTVELAAIKRAYFAQLALHPPHADAEGFRRLRAAYEVLLKPDGLRAAIAATPIDAASELDTLDRWFAEVRFRAGQIKADAAPSDWNRRFTDALATRTWRETLDAYRSSPAR